MQADYSQLEVIGVAFLSQDMNMYADIKNGIDAHSQSAHWLNPQWSYEEILAGHKAGDPFFVNLRKRAKGPRFELQYGAGYKSIARNNNISEDRAKEFVDRYYSHYWRLKEWQEENIELVKSSRTPTTRHTPGGYPCSEGYLRSPTGRRYAFTEHDAPEWMQKPKRRGVSPVYTSFSPTEIKNYPSQGFATGDIVPMVLGELYYKIKNHSHDLRENVLLINTIHDSVMLDVEEEWVEDAAGLVKRTMEEAPQMLKEKFDIDFDLPLQCEIEVGPNWADMKPI